MAEPQGGFVKRQQLLATGIGRRTVDVWLESRRLIRAYQGVYAVGHIPTEPQARSYGAMLAVGDGAALAGWSAGAFYGAVKRWREPFELIAPQRSRAAGVIVRASSTLLLRDIWRFNGLRVTSPARTALDLAARVSDARLKAIVDRLRLDHGLNLWQLRDIVTRNPRHPGARRIRALIGEANPRASRSGLERRWPSFAHDHDLPPYEMNVMVAGHEVDVLVDGVVIVELDTFKTHLTNFASDRQRDAEILAKTGIPTIRVTDEQLDEDSARVARHILAAVARRHSVADF